MSRSPVTLVTRLLLAGLALGCAVPQAARAQAGAPVTSVEIPNEAGFRETLRRHGQFYLHPTHGEVWVPTSLPQGWHPYSACKWVNHKTLGWYYDDRTEWGRIVHHYGRWTHDDRVGWMWVPGAEFSPGWVVWRNSAEWVGWAPMPPDADVATMTVEGFNSDKHWTFLEAARFKAGCVADETRQAELPRAVFTETRVVTRTRFVNGIFVVVLPDVIAPTHVVDIQVIFPAWSPGFLGGLFASWNHLWNEVTGPNAILAAATQCALPPGPSKPLNLRLPTPPAPPRPPVSPIVAPPPPPPPSPPPVVVTPPPPPVAPPPLIDPRPPVRPLPPVRPFPPIVDGGPKRPPIIDPPPVRPLPPFPPRPPRPPKLGDGPSIPPIVKDPGRPPRPPIVERIPRHQPGPVVPRFSPGGGFVPKVHAAPRFMPGPMGGSRMGPGPGGPPRVGPPRRLGGFGGGPILR